MGTTITAESAIDYRYLVSLLLPSRTEFWHSPPNDCQEIGADAESSQDSIGAIIRVLRYTFVEG